MEIIEKDITNELNTELLKEKYNEALSFTSDMIPVRLDFYKKVLKDLMITQKQLQSLKNYMKEAIMCIDDDCHASAVNSLKLGIKLLGKEDE